MVVHGLQQHRHVPLQPKSVSPLDTMLPSCFAAVLPKLVMCMRSEPQSPRWHHQAQSAMILPNACKFLSLETDPQDPTYCRTHFLHLCSSGCVMRDVLAVC